MRKNISSRPRWVLCGLFALLFSPLLSHAASFNLNLSFQAAIADNGQPGGHYTLSWDPIDPSTTDAIVTYYVFQEFGKTPMTGVGSTPAELADALFSTIDTDVVVDERTGSRCFMVVSSDSLNGPAYESFRECHDFIHGAEEGTTIARTDGDGTDRGVDQKWTFTHYMDADAKVTAKILPPGTTFTVDLNGFVIEASSPPVRTLYDNIPRTGEGSDGDKKVESTWDSRSSTGVIVPNGIYYLWVSAILDRGQLFPVPPESNSVATLESLQRDGKVITIPVDIIRIMNLVATPITLINTTSDISYFLTGDALVRVVIAKPGSSFMVDSNGDIQVTDRTTGAIDNTLVVSTFTFQRQSGQNTETWDGTSSTGTVMPSGVYAVGISARDEYGNTAISQAGDDFPIFATISLERAPGSTDGSTGGGTSDTSPPTIAAMTINGGSFTDGQVLSGSVSTITVRLSDPSGIGFGLSSISVVGPNSQSIPGTLSNNGTDTMTFVFTTPQNTNGVYTITIVAADQIGTAGTNTTTYNPAFTVSIQLSQGAFETGTRVYPNPAKGVSQATIRYDLEEAATVKVDIFNILGEKVYAASYTEAGPVTDQTQTWSLTNSDGEKVGSGLYLVRIKAVGTTSTVETIKKVVVIR